jgi:hypothetical protein
MMEGLINESPSEESERIVRECFINRPNWTVRKIDTGKHKAADFRICGTEICFLCEVKTIASSRSNYAYKPIDYYIEERNRRQKRIAKAQEEDPHRHIILPSEDYEFTFGDSDTFRQRFSIVPRFTEKYFNEFKEELVHYLITESRVKGLAYSIRIDSDDLFTPFGDERIMFFHWLENEVEAMSKGQPARYWYDNNLPFTQSYHTFKVMKIYDSGGKLRSEYQINVEKLRGDYPLQVNVFHYGVLNESTIVQEIEKAISQLEASANVEIDNQIPRVVMLAFASSLGFEEEQLYQLIIQQLKTHTRVSAIGVLRWVPETIIIRKADEDILTWLTNSFNTKHIPGFFIVHNPWIAADVKCLNPIAFDVVGSVQVSPIEIIMRD